MKLYLIDRKDNVGWDEYDSAVVAAESPEQALSFITNDPSGWTHGGYWVKDEHFYNQPNVSIKLIGTAEPEIEAGFVVASFNAG